MINQPEILDALGDKFKSEQAMALAHAITIGVNSAIEGKLKNMADTKDLELIAEKFETKIQKTLLKQTLWMFAFTVSVIGLTVTVLKYL